MHDHSYKGTTYPNWWRLESHSYAHYMNFHVSFSSQACNFEIWTWIKLGTFKIIQVYTLWCHQPWLETPNLIAGGYLEHGTLYITQCCCSPFDFLQHKKIQHGKYHRKNAVILKPLGHDFLGFWLTEMEISWDIANAGHLSKHLLQVWNKLRQLNSVHTSDSEHGPTESERVRWNSFKESLRFIPGPAFWLKFLMYSPCKIVTNL